MIRVSPQPPGSAGDTYRVFRHCNVMPSSLQTVQVMYIQAVQCNTQQFPDRASAKRGAISPSIIAHDQARQRHHGTPIDSTISVIMVFSVVDQSYSENQNCCDDELCPN